VPAPAPGPHASPAEHARAEAVWALLRRHRSLRGLLGGDG
jgi:hypothetical protein